MSMSSRLLVACAVFAFACSGAAIAAQPQSSAAAATAKPHTAQQQRMIDCNHQATGKKGAERKAFMSSCLKGRSPIATPQMANTTQQQKMKSCNAEAKTKALKGDTRKSFMSTCLKGGSTH